MIRTLILGGILAFGIGAIAMADGFAPGQEPGHGGSRLHRSAHLRHHHHARHARSVRHHRHAIAPGGLTQSLNVPLYNVPPRRFP